MALNRDCLGKAYGPIGMTVDAARIAAYAAATADPRADGDGAATAPPVFGVVPVWPAIQAVLADPQLAIDVGRVVHGEQRMAFQRLIRAGDELTTTGTISAIEDRGANEIFVLSFETRDAGGELVTTQDVVCVSRGTGAGTGTSAGAARAAIPPRPDPPPIEPDLVRVVDLPDDITFRYAAASGDDNRIHVDDEFARAVGLPGIIVQGLCLFAIALQAVTDAAAGGDPGRVRAASARFLRPIRPATALHTHVYRTPDGARFEGRGPDARAVLAGSATTA
jgi:acyl dehydratase